MVVLSVKNTELNSHHLVHVQLTKWKLVMMDLVRNVVTLVKNVLLWMALTTVLAVLLVLMIELTVHHTVHVHMELLKSINIVLHVT